jgi:alpha-glucosidase
MVHQLINLGISGFAYGGADVGGFTGGPSPELMTRWFEVAAFTPIFRDHSAKDTPRAEPWLDGPMQLAIRRRFVEERYRLLPYMYALADDNSRTGDPLMRPVFYDYPGVAGASCDQSMTFTLGKALLIAPPPKIESPESYEICLPAGGWFDYWTGQSVTGAAAGTNGGDGASHIKETPSLEKLPVFVRAGTILPRQPLVQSTSEAPKGPLYLDIYPGDDCTGTIYLDDGHSMAFQKGHYLRQSVECATGPAGKLVITFKERRGSFIPWWKRIAVVVHGHSPAEAIAGRNVRVSKIVNPTSNALEFDMPDIPAGAAIVVGT